jgi:AcrR family transcriptional regulator
MKTEEKIVKVAIDLFADQGFVKASIRDIVRKVGVTNATFYIHFKAKDNLLYHIIEGIGTVLLNELERVQKEEPDPVKCLKKMIHAQLRLVKERKKEVKIYMEEQYQLPKSLRKKAFKQHRRIYESYKQKIHEINELGLTNPLNESLVTFGIFSVMNWTYRWFKNNGLLSIDDVAEEVVSLLFHGIFKCNSGIEI